MIKKTLIIALFILTSQTLIQAGEKEEIQAKLKSEKIALETGRPRDPNITRSEYNKQRISKIRELNGRLAKIELRKKK